MATEYATEMKHKITELAEDEKEKTREVVGCKNCHNFRSSFAEHCSLLTCIVMQLHLMLSTN